MFKLLQKNKMVNLKELLKILSNFIYLLFPY